MEDFIKMSYWNDVFSAVNCEIDGTQQTTGSNLLC